jgi:hypothetical protein
MSLSDSQIKDLCVKMRIPFGDCCFKDELPEELEFNKGYFINLEDSVDQDGKPAYGTHWTFVECIKYPTGETNAIYFDPYGVSPPENVKRVVKNTIKKEGLPYTKKDIQSLMNNACGFYCLAFAHYINSSIFRTGNIFHDVECFMELFEDLNTSTDFKKNEYILKMFFRSEDPKLRKEIDVISSEDVAGEIDGFKIPVDVKYL